MSETTFSVWAIKTSVLVRINRRLQHWGTDMSLYANKHFKTPGENEPLLEAILAQLRRNDGGFDLVQVTPYSIEFCGGTFDGVERVIALLERAGRLAGIQMMQAGSTSR
jgi:hypothetical protein